MERPADFDHSPVDVLDLREQAELHAVAEPTRRKILRLLRERAASTTEIAETLEQPKGTIAHHIKVLEDAGLIQVVGTRKVRAMTERYYGRVANLYRIVADEGGEFDAATMGALMLRDAADEIASDDAPEIAVAHARMSHKTAHRFARRLEEIAAEFRELDEPGERVYGFAVGVYATDLRNLPKKKGRRRA